MILKEDKSKILTDPWFSHGNTYRLDYIGGLYQNGYPDACDGCTGATGSSSAYNSNGPY